MKPPAQVIEHPCLILYRAATGLEKAMCDVDGVRQISIPAEKIIDMWDPFEIDLNNLPLLAWAMQCRLWESGWTEGTKREWTAIQWWFQALRGTRSGIEMALKYMGRDFTGGYDLLQVVTAPQGFFASPNLTKEEMDSWIRKMPQLRIKLAHGYGVADGEFYTDNRALALDDTEPEVREPQMDGFSDYNHAGRDDGKALYGRRVVLRWPGKPDQDLGMVEWRTEVVGRKTVEFEQVSIPGLAGLAYISDEDFEGDNRFACAELKAPQLFSYKLDGSYDHISSLLHLSMLTPGLDPINVQYERDSDIGWGNSFFFDQDFASDAFADNGRDAYEMLADRIYLLDPTIAAPLMAGTSFAGIDRVDFPPYHAELMVDLITHEPLPAWFVEETSMNTSYAVPEDLTDFDRAMRAIVGAKALRDKTMADFAVRHPLAWGDTVYAHTKFGDHPPSTL